LRKNLAKSWDASKAAISVSAGQALIVLRARRDSNPLTF
jgi:hypothetical protein